MYSFFLRPVVFYHLDVSKAEVRTLIVILEAVFEYTIDTHNIDRKQMRLKMCFTFLSTK